MFGHSPLAVVVSGEAPEAWLQGLREALPSAAVTSLGYVDAETLSSVSARAHLVLSVGDPSSLPAGSCLSDALARTDVDLSRFIERARAFDRCRVSNQLPPDLAPVIEPWSPLWAATAARVGARVARVFDASRAKVDHIGSTSVPGLNAKGIIDLQVAVADLTDCDSVDGRLKDAGFVNVQEIVPDAPGVRIDNARIEGQPETEWTKRLYAGVDAAQRVIVHVRRAGAANWRYALLFRDWLRANPGPRDEYAELKTALAAAHGADAHFDDYARAKDFWFDRAQAEMEDWARTTGWVPPSS